MKKCPYCAEEIQDEAIKCRFCGMMIQEDPPSVTPEPETTPPTAKRKSSLAARILGYLGSGIILFFAIMCFLTDATLAGVAFFGAGVAFIFLAPIGWAIGDAFRRFAHPDFYLANGAMDLAQKRLFWMVGPQLITVGVIFVVLIFFCQTLIPKSESEDHTSTLQSQGTTTESSTVPGQTD